MAMNFFEHQDRAKQRSQRLVVYFVMAIAGIIAALYFVITPLIGLSGARYGGSINWWRPDLLAATAAGVLFVIGLGSLWKTWRLRQGGAAVATLLGGVPVAPNTTDADERRLLNVVEEMAIASGMPVPEVFLLPDENGINAFAAGHTPGNAAIGVTRGCVEALTRDELQGVIAHEFSHILHGDMRLNIRLMGILHGILVIGLLGFFLIRSLAFAGRSRGRNSGGVLIAIVAVGATMTVAGYVGLFFGRLIKAAVSRQREYLADSSAVQFTRNPEGISGALKKIGGIATGSRLQAPRAEQASHMFFGTGNKKRFLFSRLLATHPPLEERIKAIEPNFDGELKSYDEGYHAPRSDQAAAVSGLAGGANVIHTTPEKLVAQVGEPTAEHVAYSHRLLQSLPAEVLAAAREPFGAQAVIYALLLDHQPAIRQTQLDALKTSADAAAYDETRRIADTIATLPRDARLPVIDLSIPALRRYSPDQIKRFDANVETLIQADQKVDLFEFTLKKVLMRHLVEAGNRPARSAHYGSLQAVARETGLLLSTLAYAGHNDVAEAKAAYAAALARTGLSASEVPMSQTQHCTLDNFDYALNHLEAGSPDVKRQLLLAAAECVAHDGQITVEEAQLVRAVADHLDCPMPPLLG